MLNDRSRSDWIVLRCCSSAVRQHLARVVVPAVLDRMVDRVEHQRDPGERLHGAVVELQREPPALVLLGGDPLLEEANPLAFLPPPLALPALDGLVSQ